MSFYPEVVHPDPQWWLRSPTVTQRPTNMDLCQACGHVRDKHSPNGACHARSSSLIGDPAPCFCQSGTTFRKPVVVDRPR